MLLHASPGGALPQSPVLAAATVRQMIGLRAGITIG